VIPDAVVLVRLQPGSRSDTYPDTHLRRPVSQSLKSLNSSHQIPHSFQSRLNSQTHTLARLTHDATHTDHSSGGTAHSDGGQQDQEDLDRMSRGRHVCSDDCVYGVVEYTLLHAQLCGWWSAHFAVSFCLRAFACVCLPLLFSHCIYIRSCARVR
jgi:hypothetical protein